MKPIFGNGSYANVTATLALVIALGGTSYAAIKLPKNSVSSLQVKDRSLLKKDFRPGQLPRGKTGRHRPQGPAGPAGGAGAGGGSSAILNRAEAVEALVPGTGDQVVHSMNLPAGSFVCDREVRRREKHGRRRPAVLHAALGGAAIDNLGPGGIDFDAGRVEQHADGCGLAGRTRSGAGRLQHGQPRARPAATGAGA